MILILKMAANFINWISCKYMTLLNVKKKNKQSMYINSNN